MFEGNQNRLKDFPIIKEEIFLNKLGLPNGRPVDGWNLPKELPKEPMEGRNYRVELLTSNHIPDMNETFSDQDQMWKYSRFGPFKDSGSFVSWIESLSNQPDAIIFSVVNIKTNKSVGMAAFVAINPEFGSIQIGHLHFAPNIQANIVL